MDVARHFLRRVLCGGQGHDLGHRLRMEAAKDTLQQRVRRQGGLTHTHTMGRFRCNPFSLGLSQGSMLIRGGLALRAGPPTLRANPPLDSCMWVVQALGCTRSGIAQLRTLPLRTSGIDIRTSIAHVFLGMGHQVFECGCRLLGGSGPRRMCDVVSAFSQGRHNYVLHRRLWRSALGFSRWVEPQRSVWWGTGSATGETPIQ